MDLHHNHHHPLQQQQQQHSTPPPPPPPHKQALLDQDAKRRTLLPLSFSNGTLKKHRPLYPLPPLPHNHVAYRECMKNHAASLGGHALDGCGEFMPSPDANPADPASLTCDACGCHRNFHRRLLNGGAAAAPPLAPDHHPHPHREEREVEDGAAEDEDADEAVDDDDEEGHGDGSPPRPHTQAATHQYYSAPHMLMALSTGLPGGASGSSPAAAGATSSAAQAAGVGGMQLPRKRFRTKFSPLQKGRMQELSERLGWRMQKRDEALVEQSCREIGVSRGVFKVWMHNNKHNFVGGPSSRRAGSGIGIGGTAGGGGGGGPEAPSSNGGGLIGGGVSSAGVNGVEERNGVGNIGCGDERNGGGGSGSGGHVLTSSSPSS